MTKKATCKNPNGDPTSKQTFAIFCMTRNDVRDVKMTRQEASNVIGALKSDGVATLPSGTVIHHKDSKKVGVESGKASKKVPGNGGKPYDKNRWALDLLKQADAAGERALKELIDSKKVKPMVVQQHADIADDNSPVTQQWVVGGGPCGFASIRVKCVNGPSRKFIAQLKKAGLAGGQNSHCEWNKSDYYGGFMKSFGLIGGQSLAYKSAYAYAYEGVLAGAGINTWVWTRMD
jgi:hypothetical protein